MKQLVAFLGAVLAVSVAAAPAHAQSTMRKDSTAAADRKPQGPSHKASGTVTKIDAAGGKVTIAHGPVQSLKWPAMTMSFGVGDKALLEGVQPGKKVEFEFAQQGSSYVITKIR
jgi:Cu(I)/Ag(I) efflux system periplasmic protein CusF